MDLTLKEIYENQKRARLECLEKLKKTLDYNLKTDNIQSVTYLTFDGKREHLDVDMERFIKLAEEHIILARKKDILEFAVFLCKNSIGE